ncbi:MAG TPA: hypothetical protein VFW85_01185 [Gaiellaceae bacterium]|nr:hypothetical protein [Gaiellaceae bacterium]
MDVGDRVLHRVMQRLERIETLDRDVTPPGELLAELRLLVGEAEEWAGVEGDHRAMRAVEQLRAVDKLDGKAGGMR